jgi:class 3 adenylate cyclase
MTLDRAKKELVRLIALRNKQPYRAEEIDGQIWERFGTRCFVAVSDLSGFTLPTRQHGILHFLVLYQRSLEICKPELETCSGRLLKGEEDNTMVTFEDPRKALECAVRINRALNSWQSWTPCAPRDSSSTPGSRSPPARSA